MNGYNIYRGGCVTNDNMARQSVIFVHTTHGEKPLKDVIIITGGVTIHTLLTLCTVLRRRQTYGGKRRSCVLQPGLVFFTLVKSHM